MTLPSLLRLALPCVNSLCHHALVSTPGLAAICPRWARRCFVSVAANACASNDRDGRALTRRESGGLHVLIIAIPTMPGAEQASWQQVGSSNNGQPRRTSGSALSEAVIDSGTMTSGVGSSDRIGALHCHADAPSHRRCNHHRPEAEGAKGKEAPHGRSPKRPSPLIADSRTAEIKRSMIGRPT
jgi:hypothetical protein